ncbi:hypothetical protein ACFLS8_03545 [Chloroflexota bacterium]
MTLDKDKIKEQLITELTILRQRVTDLEKTNEDYRQAEYQLQERYKELNCIYAITQIIDDSNLTLQEVYQLVADILPSGFMYPEIACAKIIIGEHYFKTRKYKETEWKLSSDIEVEGEIIGTVEVYYLESKPEMDLGPFLNAEWLLISIAAGRLGRITELMQAKNRR